jgi:Pheromone A receptor
MTICTFYKHQREFRQMTSSSQGLSHGRYLRLMALSATEIFGTIPLGTYFIVSCAKAGVRPWESWADMHRDYSEVIQVPSIVWKNDPFMANGVEMFRWLIVACAFTFFAFFGFADEARQHYRRVYTSLASRVGHSTTFAPHESSHACVVHVGLSRLTGGSHFFFFFGSTSSVPYVKSECGVTFLVVTTGGNKRISSVLFTDQPSIPSISIAGDLKPDFKTKQYLHSNSLESFSVESLDEPRMQGQSTLPVVIMPTVPPPSVPPHLPDTTKSTMRAYTGIHAV